MSFTDEFVDRILPIFIGLFFGLHISEQYKTIALDFVDPLFIFWLILVFIFNLFIAIRDEIWYLKQKRIKRI